MEQMKLLPQLLPRIFKRGGVVSPVRKACGDGHDDGVQERHLPEVLENLGVFIISYAVLCVQKQYAGRRFAKGGRTRLIEHDSVYRALRDATTTEGEKPDPGHQTIHIV